MKVGIENSGSLKSPPSNASKKVPAFLARNGTKKAPSIKVDNKPWSAYSDSDYSITQWDSACLIHDHDGPATAKSQCKLPVKTPDGIVNKDGVFAATAALAGARGGIQASDDQKMAAAKALLSLYNKLGQKPPPSLMQMSHSVDVGKFLDHHGVKGQKWGIRNPRSRFSSARSESKKQASKFSDEEIQKRIKRLELEKRYHELTKPETSAGKKYAHDILKNSGKSAAGTVVGTTVAFAVGKALKAKFG